MQSGYTTFISGAALGFDMMAGSAVLKMKKSHPQVQLVLAIPCRDQDAKWSPAERQDYRQLLAAADHVEFISEAYDAVCMKRRNQWMVDHSKACIAYLRYERTGTAQTARMAREQGLNLMVI